MFVPGFLLIRLFGALELVKHRGTKEPFTPFGPYQTSEPLQKMSAFMKEQGLFHFLSGHILHTNPPLCITEQQLHEGLDIIDKGLDIADQHTHANQ